MPPDSQADGTSEQTDADNGDLPKLHAAQDNG
jgi:hypothetical protein